ncbi:MAG: cysteine desulfurase [Candidatus Micrarchaeaceae archaeon]
MINAELLRKDFPILEKDFGGSRLVYLDNAATSQKPKQVINAIVEYYSSYNANIHRGIYKIANKATEAYVSSKEKVAGFINAEGIENIVYVRNTTEAINLVALTYGAKSVKKGDHILISEMEHHSNLVPWQLLAKAKGAILDYVKLDSKDERLDMDDFESKINKNPKIVAITQVSNVLGTINDVERITKIAHEYGATVLVDGAQSVPHMKVDVKKMDCDFLAFSGHKMLGPTGIGVLYGKKEILEHMEPLFGGGDMIAEVTKKSSTWNDLPWKFEAGTSNIEGGVGFGAAIDYLKKISIDEIFEYEKKLTKYALEKLKSIYGIEIFGPKDCVDRSSVISFGIPGVHPHDVAQVFDSYNIAIRAGHHCAMPLVNEVLNRGAVSRMSFYFYNTKEDIDKAVYAIEKVKELFKIR